MLTPSFRPADPVVILRSYLRQRQMLALEQMNVKLADVVSDITGVTGPSIIKGILCGESYPLQLAKLRNDQCKRTEAEIARG
jgi:hypothetical protein